MKDNIVMITHCNRCNTDIPHGEARDCWYCLEYLCPSCWEEYGNCDHFSSKKDIQAAFFKVVDLPSHSGILFWIDPNIHVMRGVRT